jgi:predicted nucleic acid-binding protein
VKIVLDTNVFVSGVFFSGPPHQILQAWRGGKVQLAIAHCPGESIGTRSF